MFPFSRYETKTSKTGVSSKTSNTVFLSVTVPVGVTHGLLACISSGWAGEISQSAPSGNGIKSIKSVRYSQTATAATSSIVSLYECDFNPMENITFFATNNNSNHMTYASAHLILLA